MSDNENKTQEELKQEFEEDLRNNPENDTVGTNIKNVKDMSDKEKDEITPPEMKSGLENKYGQEHSIDLDSIPEITEEQMAQIRMDADMRFDEELSRDSEIIDNVAKSNPELKEENDEAVINYIDHLEGVLFKQRMIKERENQLKEKIELEKQKLKEEDLSYIQRKKREKEIEKAAYEDLYGVEKKLAEDRLQAIKSHEEIEKKIKQTGGLNKDLIAQKEGLETKFMLGDTLDDYIEAAYNDPKVKEQLEAKFPNVKKSLDADIMNMADQHKFENKNLRRADGVTQLFRKENPTVEKEVNGFMSKLSNFTKNNQKTLKVAGNILSGVALVTNPVGTMAAKGIGAIMKTKAMKKFKESISNDIGHGLDKLGIKENSKLRRGLKLAGAVTGLAATVGVAMLAANEVDMADIAKQASEIQGMSSEFLSQGQQLGDEALKSASDLGQRAMEGGKELAGVATQYGNQALENGKNFVDGIVNDSNNLSVNSETPPASNPVPEVDQSVEGAINQSTHVIQSGDQLGYLLEKIDGVDFDLQGNELHSVAQVIAEQQNMDVNNLKIGAAINLPSTTADLEAFVEQNRERINEVMQQRIEEANALAAGTIPEVPQITDAQIDVLNGNVDDITEKALAQSDISNRDFSEIRKEFGISKNDLEELISENIKNQIAEGKFPTSIELNINDEDGVLFKSLSIPDFRLETAANVVLQDNNMSGIQNAVEVANNNGVGVDYNNENIEKPNANENKNGTENKNSNNSRKPGMKLS